MPINKDKISESTKTIVETVGEINQTVSEAKQEFKDNEGQKVVVEVPNVPATVSPALIGKLVAYVVILVNAVLAILGYDPIHLADDTVYLVSSVITLVGGFGYATWKNHDITKNARKKAEVTEQVKDEL